MSNISQLFTSANSAINPYLVPELALWLDSTDAATITSSAGLVSSWASKANVVNSMNQATDANKPSTGTRSFNGLNVLDFNGTTTYLTSPKLVFLNLVTNGYTVFTVGKFDLISTAYVFLAGGNRVYVGRASTGSWQLVASTAVASFATSSVSLLTPAIVTCTYDPVSTNADIYANSSVVSATTAGIYTGVPAAVFIGAQTSTTNFLDGWVGEIIVYNRKLSAIEISRIQQYLSSKWGISNP